MSDTSPGKIRNNLTTEFPEAVPGPRAGFPAGFA